MSTTPLEIDKILAFQEQIKNQRIFFEVPVNISKDAKKRIQSWINRINNFCDADASNEAKLSKSMFQ